MTEFKTKPMQHQLKALEVGGMSEYFAYLMEMGTGKSKVLIDNIALLYRKGAIGAAVYLAPKGAYRDFSDLQIGFHLPDDIPRQILTWSSPLPKDWEYQVKQAFAAKDKLVILVMNIEAIAYENGERFAYDFVSKVNGQVLMAIDESTCIKNHKAGRSKAAIKLGRMCAFRRILSGSPVTRSPMDMFGQGLFLAQKALGVTSYFAYRARYAVTREQRLTGGRSIPIIVGYQRLDELKDIVQRWSYRVLKKDCLDLPEKIYQFREVEMTPEQKSLYKQMAKEGVAYLGENGVVTAVGALALLTRLHQITCGHLRNDDGTFVDVPNNRFHALMEVLEQTSGKVIIWATYVPDILKIKQAIIKEYGEDSVVDYYGGTSDADRVSAKADFQNSSKVRFFIGNPSTGRYSLTLTEASTVVYFSNSYDLEHRIQSEDRAHRIGQTKNVTYIDLVIRKTMDEVIYKSLKMKINIAAEITGDKLKEWLAL